MMISSSRYFLLKRGMISLLLGFILFTCFLLTPSVYAEHLKWSTYQIEGEQCLRIVEKSSVENFFVYTASGRLYRFDTDSFELICEPPTSTFLSVSYHITQDRIYIIVVDSEYHSFSYRKEGSSWIFEGEVSNVPVRNFIEDNSGNLWLFGDWGELYKRDQQNNVWIKQETPLEKHILQMYPVENDVLWIGTRSEGLWEFQNGNFEKLHIPSTDFCDVIRIFEDNENKIQVRLSDGRLYIWENNNFKLLNSHYIYRNGQHVQIHKGIAFLKSTSSNIELWRDNTWQRMIVPSQGGIRDFYMFEDGSSIVLSSDGKVVTGKKDEGLYFYEQASHLRLGGSLNDNTIQAAFLDLNGDEKLDIIALNEDYNIFNQFFLNDMPEPFEEISSQIQIENERNNYAMVLGDLNKDRRSDVLISQATSEGHKFLIYEQIFGGRFHKRQSIKGEIPIQYHLRGTHLIDYDQDGDLDIYLVYYYGEGQNLRGKNLMLENKFWGNFSVVEMDSLLESPGWNESILVADFNNDDRLDYYSINRWMKNRLILSQSDTLVEVTETAFNVDIPANSYIVTAFDIDVDNDLDILVLTQRNEPWLFINNGKGEFKERSEKFGLKTIFNGFGKMIANVAIGDFDHNGFPDMFCSNRSQIESDKKTTILLNYEGNRFEVAEGIGIEDELKITSSIIGDIDNDGDLDIYNARDGVNSVYVNQLNRENFLKLHLNGVVSNTEGKHSKIWVYESGFIGVKQRLIGYQQVGSTQYNPGFRNGTEAGFVHFGLGENTKVDVVVRFISGREKIFRNIKPGMQLEVEEYNDLVRVLYSLPAYTLSVLRIRTVQIYLTVVLLTAFVLVLAVQIAIKILRWSLTAIATFMLINLTAFWLILVLTANSESNLRFIVPFVLVLFGTFIPILFYYSAKIKNTSVRSQVYDKLLEQLLIFGHGEWALGNLNSLKRLVEFLAVSKELNQNNVIQLKDRIETYLGMTYPNLLEIIKLGKELRISSPALDTIALASKLLDSELTRMNVSDLTLWNKNDIVKSEVPKAVDEIRNSLRQLKDIVFQDYSCDAIKVLKQTLQELGSDRIQSKIETPKLNLLETSYVLIKGYELAGILDNCIRNAYTSMREQETKKLELSVEKSGQRFIITIKDSGKGIEEDIREKIFEIGFSSRGGTGLGLSQAKDILKKYGGNIYLKSSSLGHGSTFIIQLNEGRKKSETTGTYSR